ncbi:MAG TPA: SIMPL domain-containing protein [Candidatus Acidoferrales bacterium]|nr:SIMPL domain-containing protein [Candidatus Acidoferrales bacterium]
MKQTGLYVCLLLFAVPALRAQNPEPKFIAETLVVQAEGSYESDPDLATLTFAISSQEKDLSTAYGKASQAMQKIAALAEKNGLRREDVSSGVLTVTPFYGGERRKKPKSFAVQGEVALKIRDFSKLGPIMDESVSDEITDFRSLTYSLSDEEAAKERAVAEAMRRAVGRATAALEQKGQKVGALRFANLDVKQLVGVAQYSLSSLSTVEVEATGGGGSGYWHRKTPLPSAPLPSPEKIKVSATVQCAFQIQ